MLNLWSVLLPCAAGLFLARSTHWGSQLGAPLLVLLLSLALAATGLIHGPVDLPWISGSLTALAVAVLLLPLQLKRLLPEAHSLLWPFGAAIGLVCVASIVSGMVLAVPLGPQHAAVSGVLAAGYTGGTVNLVAVADALSLAPAQMTMVMAADSVVGIGWFLISLLASRGFMAKPAATQPEPPVNPQQRRLRSTTITLLIGIAVVLVAAAVQRWLAPLDLPYLLIVTSVALIAAQTPVVAAQRLDQEVGMLLLLPFFSEVGLESSWRALFPAGGWVLLAASAIVAIQAVGLLVLNRHGRIALPQMLVASQAVVGGPTTAAVLAAALGRKELIVPAVALGMLGYLLGSYLGLAVERAVSLLS